MDLSASKPDLQQSMQDLSWSKMDACSSESDLASSKKDAGLSEPDMGGSKMDLSPSGRVVAQQEEADSSLELTAAGLAGAARFTRRSLEAK